MKRSGLRSNPAKVRDWQDRSRVELSREAPPARGGGMKRGPYKPKEPGKTIVCANPGCGEEVYKRASDLRKGARYCSRRCFASDAAARKAPAKNPTRREDRMGEANPAFKHGKRAGARDRAGERRFKSGQERCAHPMCEGPYDPGHEHHVVYEQHVRRESGDRWDPRNALRVCVSCHSSHHRCGRKILPLSALRDANYEFAFELLGPAAFDYLTRRYAGTDPRLKQWLRKTEAAAATSGDTDTKE